MRGCVHSIGFERVGRRFTRSCRNVKKGGGERRGIREEEKEGEEKKGQESWGEKRGGEGYIRNLILISPQFNYSADKSCTCTA